MKTVRIASGSAYWGDALDPAVEAIERGGINYIGFDHLAELTMAVLQRWKEKDPVNRGFIPDIVPWVKACLPVAKEKKVKLITNAGGANPEAAAREVVKVAREMNMRGTKIGVVVGDDIMGIIDKLRAEGIKFPNLDTGEEDIDRIRDRLVAANTLIGADHIIEGLKKGAEVIIAGRVSDNALYVGPWMYEFGWEYKEPYWNKIGAAVTAGHIVECSCMCTGGASNMWREVTNMGNIGFPIVEMDENGDCIVTKTPNSGGIVNQWTVKEHLVYEVHDPRNYLMPDGIADFTTLKVEEIGKDRVSVTNMSGKPRPDTLKVCMGYSDGFIGEGIVFYPWPDAYEKAKKAAEMIRERLKKVKLDAEELRVDFMGVNMLHENVSPEPDYDLNEVGVRVIGKTKTQAEAEKIRREATHLWTMGPIGSSFGTPLPIRPVVSLWPTLVPREFIHTSLVMMEA